MGKPVIIRTIAAPRIQFMRILWIAATIGMPMQSVTVHMRMQPATPACMFMQLVTVHMLMQSATVHMRMQPPLPA